MCVGGGAYELVGGGDDDVDDVADAVGLEESAARVGGVALQLAHGQALEPLQVLVRRARGLQHRRRHRRHFQLGHHSPLLRWSPVWNRQICGGGGWGGQRRRRHGWQDGIEREKKKQREEDKVEKIEEGAFVAYL